MFEIRVSLDDQMHLALIEDASRHLRPALSHAKALLRQALGLPVPYPEGFDERDPDTWSGPPHTEIPQETGKPPETKAEAAHAG